MATPNMNLTELVPNVTPGPQYASDIVANFTTIDQHNHTTGQGAKIPVAGLNINANLPINGFSLLEADRVQFNNRSVAPSGSGNYRSLSVVSGDLYFLDNSGNSIQITSSGGVNVSGTGNLGGVTGSAGVNFLLASDSWQLIDDGGDRARLTTSDVRIYEKGATSISEYVGLLSPSSLASTYSLTFPPALPASTGYLASNASGDLSFATADGIAANITTTGANDIIDTYTRPTGATVAERGVAISSAATFFQTSATSFTAVTNLSVTITTNGRPVFVGLIATDVGGGRIALTDVNTDAVEIGADIQIKRGSTVVADSELRYVSVSLPVDPNDNTLGGAIPPSSVWCIDSVSAGTYTYTVEVRNLQTTNASSSISIRQTKLVAFEL